MAGATLLIRLHLISRSVTPIPGRQAQEINPAHEFAFHDSLAAFRRGTHNLFIFKPMWHLALAPNGRRSIDECGERDDG